MWCSSGARREGSGAWRRRRHQPHAVRPLGTHARHQGRQGLWQLGQGRPRLRQGHLGRARREDEPTPRLRASGRGDAAHVGIRLRHRRHDRHLRRHHRLQRHPGLALPLDATEALPGQPSFQRRAGRGRHQARRRGQGGPVSLADVRLRRYPRVSPADAGEQASLRQHGRAGECDEARIRRLLGGGSMPADTATANFNNVARYEALMDVARNRMTNRAFAPWEVPREHFEMILEAARHAPSGANAQPWHYIVVSDPEVKQTIGQCFVDEQQHRARLRMGFPTPNYNGVKTAPGLIVIAADFRFIKAFPVLNDGSDLDRLYKQNAERILLQSVAASTMSAHLAAAALGYAVWWITAIGQEDIQSRVKPLLGVPDELAVIDVMCFGPPLKPSYKRWKKRLDQIMSWDRFNPDNAMTDAQIDEWVRTTRHKVMYKDESKID